MKREIDRVKEARDQYKNLAVQFVKSWADREAAQYEEPTRAGTPKGDPIGFSREKYRAALLMVLYPNCLKLRGISEISGVTYGMLRLWRTEPEFQKLMYEKFQWLGKLIAETIRRIIEQDEARKEDHLEIKGYDSIETVHGLRDILPFLNSVVSDPIFDLIDEGLEHEDYLTRHSYVGFTLGFSRSGYVHDEKSLREYERRPQNLKLTKALIANRINLLVEGKIAPETSFEDLRDFGEKTKELIFSKLDILAK